MTNEKHGMSYCRDTTNQILVVLVVIAALLYHTGNSIPQYIALIIFFIAFLIALFAPTLLYPYL